MSVETIAKVACITMFLLFAYFMIGGYTPCNPSLNSNPRSPIEISQFESYETGAPINTQYIDNNYANGELNKVILPNQNYRDNIDKNIYQRGPYINF